MGLFSRKHEPEQSNRVEILETGRDWARIRHPERGRWGSGKAADYGAADELLYTVGHDDGTETLVFDRRNGKQGAETVQAANDFRNSHGSHLNDRPGWDRLYQEAIGDVDKW